MHQSIFSYNITRRYPFKWFTPSVIIGAVIAIVLVSFINVPNAGYELIPISSSNPNATENDRNWFGGWSSIFIGNSRATCAETTLPLNTRVYTNSTALPYTLSRIWRKGPPTQDLGSLVYHNNVLQNCSITKVFIKVQGRLERVVAGQIGPSWCGISLKAYTTCVVEIDTSPQPYQPTFIELIGTYDSTGSYDSPDGYSQSFLARNQTTKASLYWGESLLQWYSLLVSKSYYDATAEAKNGSEHQTLDFRATLGFKRRSNDIEMTTDEVTSPDFFKVNCLTPNTGCGSENITALSEGKGNGRPYPTIWRRADILAKATYFTVLTDLGRSDPSVSNMLTSPDLLQHLSGNLTDEVRYWEKMLKDARDKNIDPHVRRSPSRKLSGESFNASVDPQPVLGAVPAVLSMNYICQVPRTKSAGALFFSVLIADLVLLQAIWLIFKLITDESLARKHPEMGCCDGCVRGEGKLLD